METKNQLIVKCISVVIIMILFAYLWNDACNEWFNDGAHCFFRKNRANDIKELSLCVFGEEFVWRFVPISLAATLILITKNKIVKQVLTLLLAIIILSFQIEFGYLHFDQAAESSCIPSLFTQGGTGILLAITYIIVLYLQIKSKDMQNNGITKPRLMRFLGANLGAYCASSTVHTASNVIMVFTQTF